MAEIVVDGNTLSPRQPVQGTPYSIQTRGIHVTDNESFVGVGRDYQITTAEVFGIYKNTNGFGGMYVETEGGDPFYGYANGGTLEAYHYVDGSTGEWILFNNGVKMSIGDDGSASIGTALTAGNDGSVGIGNDALIIADDGYVGIGTSAPEALLHVQDGSAGNVVAQINSSAVFERSTHNHVSILSPDDTQRGFLFGDPENEINGGILYNSSQTPDGFQIRTGGNVTQMTIDANGYVGIGRNSPVSDTSQFDVQSSAGNNQWGGMHVNTAGTQGIPYYAYGTGGVTQAHTYYNGASDKWHLWIGGNTPLVVQQDGRVGLSTFTPGYLLECNGSAGKPGGGSWSNSSDRRLKKNIAGLEGSLEKLMKLRGVSFEYLDPKSINELEGERIGVIAQEVEKVFPDWVHERTDGYKAVTFRGFEALTVEALRELRVEKDQEITKLQNENDELRNRLEALEATVLNLMEKP